MYNQISMGLYLGVCKLWQNFIAHVRDPETFQDLGDVTAAFQRTDGVGTDRILGTAYADAFKDSYKNALDNAYDNLFWNKIAKDIAMLTTRAPGWNIGASGRHRRFGGSCAACARCQDAGQRFQSTDRTVYLATLAPEDTRIAVDMLQAFDRTIMSHELVHLIQNRAGSSNYVDPDKGASTHD